jgi:hypothetical protein
MILVGVHIQIDTCIKKGHSNDTNRSGYFDTRRTTFDRLG